MIYKIQQEIEFKIQDYLIENAQGIFYTASNQGRTVAKDDYLHQMNFTISDALVIPIRIDLRNNNGLASIQLG